MACSEDDMPLLGSSLKILLKKNKSSITSGFYLIYLRVLKDCLNKSRCLECLVLQSIQLREQDMLYLAKVC